MSSDGQVEINIKKNIVDYKHSFDHKLMTRYIELFSERYSFIEVSSIGRSLFGKDIPLISLGKGDRAILYVGAHHASEWITSVILLRYINEYCELHKNSGRIYGHPLSYIFSTRKIYVIPMLNPDGVDYHINGVNKENLLYDRVVRMNEGNDFLHWQANARGVDLNHNYNCGFEEYKRIEQENGIFGGAPTKYSGTEPESEPETKAICNFLRFKDDIRSVITLHSQGEEIYYSSGGKTAPRSLSMANVFSRMSGYKLSVPSGSACFGGLLDWCIQELNIPAFTFECGKGENPLPLEDYFKIYSDLREVLFLAPTML